MLRAVSREQCAVNGGAIHWRRHILNWHTQGKEPHREEMAATPRTAPNSKTVPHSEGDRVALGDRLRWDMISPQVQHGAHGRAQCCSGLQGTTRSVGHSMVGQNIIIPSRGLGTGANSEELPLCGSA